MKKMVINEGLPLIDMVQRLMKNPWGMLLGVLYCIALGILLYQRDLKGLIMGLGTVAFVLLFIWLALKFTEGRAVQISSISWPWLGLGVWLLIEVTSSWLGYSKLFPHLTIRNLEVGNAILRKILLLNVIPFLFLWAKGDSLHSMGLDLSHWHEDLKLALLLGEIGLIPVLLFGYLSWGPTLFQQVTPKFRPKCPWLHSPEG